MGSEPRLSDATLTLLELLGGGRSFFSGMLHTKDHTSLVCHHVEKMGLEIKANQRKKTGKRASERDHGVAEFQNRAVPEAGGVPGPLLVRV